MNKFTKLVADPQKVIDYCNYYRIITENEPYAPSKGYLYDDNGMDKCYLIYKRFYILTVKQLHYCLYRFMYLNKDNSYLDNYLDTMSEFAYFISDESNNMVLTSFSDEEVERAISKTITKYELDSSNNSLMKEVLFVRKKFLFGYLNPDTNQRYTHSEIMQIVNMNKVKFTDESFIEAVEFLHESHNDKINYKMVADVVDCSLQTARQKMPLEAKEMIKEHNLEISEATKLSKIEEAIRHLTRGGDDKMSVRYIKQLTHIKDYALIKRIINKYSK